jgi:plasmid stabilization system protein ParE
MNFVVRWNEVALSQLADIWVHTNDRSAVTKAAHAIDRLLAGQAATCGEPRSAILRAVIVRPLWVQYQVDLSTRTVTVQNILLLPINLQD